MVYFTRKLMVWQWDHLLDLPLPTHFFHTMKKTGYTVVRKDSMQFFTDNIFVLFKSNDYLKYFYEFLNSCHVNMFFSTKTERQNKFSFLNVEVIHEQGKFTSTIYRKLSFSGVYSNSESFWPSLYNFGLICTLVYRCLRIYLDKVPYGVNFFEKDIS